jgi:hypothetical protein
VFNQHIPRRRADISFARLFLGRHLQEEIQSEEKENNIRRPSGQKRWQLSNSSHRLQQLRQRPVNNSDGDADGYAADRSARAHKKSKRYRQ